jgi:predicted patatin/cPLA2 family phospholipase
MYQSTLSHLDGDIDEISKAVLASASIPDIVHPQLIDGNLYQDGGVCYTSSLTPLSLHIQDICNSYDGLFQATYFGSYDMNQIETVLQMAPSKTFRRIYQKIHYSLLEERSLLIHIFQKFVTKFKTINILNIDRTRVHEILNKNKDQHYLLLLYPNGILDINIINFKASDIFKVIDDVIYSGLLFIKDE